MNNKAKQIISRETYGSVPYVMVLSYLLDKGMENVKQIVDAQIDMLEGNGMMTKSFVQDLVKAARAVARECDQNDVVRLFKSDWCCSGEVYDPELDQFVTDTDDDYEEEET